jgi:16S rRNA G966 N2-methylase RsmD
MASVPRHDRRFLLMGAKRNAVLELQEIERYGIDSYGDADWVSIYGLRPAEWYARGVRMLGRTAVECTRDRLGDAIGRHVATVVRQPSPLVVDLFAGSGNTLYWLLRHLPRARGVGFEIDPVVFALTRDNLAALALPVDIRNVDYVSGLADVRVSAEQLLVVFIAPPWGEALDPTSGLDLRRTTPSITEILDVIGREISASPLLCVIQVLERLVPGPLAEVRTRFDWSELQIFHLNAPGEKPGVLLGANGWNPRMA